MKPKIYFKRYPSGLGFWCVSGMPHAYRTNALKKAQWKAAYALASNLNNPAKG